MKRTELQCSCVTLAKCTRGGCREAREREEEEESGGGAKTTCQTGFNFIFASLGFQKTYTFLCFLLFYLCVLFFCFSLGNKLMESCTSSSFFFIPFFSGCKNRAVTSKKYLFKLLLLTQSHLAEMEPESAWPQRCKSSTSHKCPSSFQSLLRERERTFSLQRGWFITDKCQPANVKKPRIKAERFIVFLLYALGKFVLSKVVC